MKKYYIKLVMVLISVCLMFISTTYADTDMENMELARISHILDATFPIIEAAEKQVNPNQRLKFHYDWLKKDIQDIQAGITEKIKKNQLEPRVIIPLKTKLTTARHGHQ